LDKEVAGIVTSSEAILKEFASKLSLTAGTINALIKDVLKDATASLHGQGRHSDYKHVH
jgi:hypothetical protein